MSNLRLIDETTISSAVSSVNVTDIFSSDYDVYKLVIDDMVSTNGYWYLRPINSSGSVVASGDNDNATLLLKANASFVEYTGGDTTSIWNTANICHSSGNNGVFYFFNPYNSSTYTYMIGDDIGYAFSYARPTTNVGVHMLTSRITGLNISQQSSGTFSAGQIRTYGLRVDS